MSNSDQDLLEDPIELKILNQVLSGKVTFLEQENRLLRERIRLLLAQRYGRRSEETPSGQMSLFDEAEVTPPATDEPSEPEDAVTVPGHTRRKRGRQPLPPELPRVEIIHDLPEAERVCDVDGTTLEAIGQETSEQLDIIPAQVRVLRHVRIKYGCPCCRQKVVTASLPPQVLPKSNASPGLLAHVLVCKYVDGLPLYRQEEILQRIGVNIPRATLANWTVDAGLKVLQVVVNLMRDELLGYDIMQMDETTVQVLHEKDRPATSKSYMWLQRGGPPDKPVILFNYDPSRGGAVARELLRDFKGYLQTDGYVGYAVVDLRPEIKHIGCFAHARRKFDEALKAAGPTAAKKRTGVAGEALNRIQKLYFIEKRLREAKATPQHRWEVRQKEARPILESLKIWMSEQIVTVLPTSATGKALHYLHNQWTHLIGYLEDGRLEIDNNLAENAIRPFVMGRKNWLFSNTGNGATASANIYSVIETAKANGLEPYTYLRHVFEKIPAAQTADDFDALLPWNLTSDMQPKIKPAL